MTCIDLIIILSKLPPDLEVVYDNTQPGDEGFRLCVVENAYEINDDKGESWVILNLDESEEGEETI